jgi:RimJ/RimL family protein N-acetyltransferase
MFDQETGNPPGEISTSRTSRLFLRRPRAADAVAVARLANDRVIAENTARIPYPYTEAHAAAWIEDAASEDADRVLLAFLGEGGALVGAGGIEHNADGAELGYWIGAPFRGQGLGTELARALVDHAFEVWGVDRLTVRCRVTNAASRAVIERCGFQWMGCGLVSSIGLKGAFPVDQFRLDRRTWQSLVAWGMNRAYLRGSGDRASA